MLQETIKKYKQGECYECGKYWVKKDIISNYFCDECLLKFELTLENNRSLNVECPHCKEKFKIKG